MSDESNETHADGPTDVRSELAAILSDECNEAGISNRLMHESVIEGPDGAFTMPAQIVVPLDVDGTGDSPEVIVFFLPVFDDPPVVQYMVFLDDGIAGSASADLARIIALVNSHLTITGFEFSETLGTTAFRHSHAVGTQPLDPGVIAWPLSVIRETIDNYGPLVRYVAAGGDFDVAISAIVIG